MATQGQPITRVVVPAREGRGVVVHKGQRLRVVNPEGQQVGDLFAFVLGRPTEFLSPSHTRSQLRRIYPEVGRPLYSNLRRPLFLLEEDTVGVHDLLISACDPIRYRDLGAPPEHRSCRENLREALQAFNLEPPVLPDPVNLFMKVEVDAEGRWQGRDSPARPGDYVTLGALEDLLVVVSACPFDLGPLNGPRITDLVLEVYA